MWPNELNQSFFFRKNRRPTGSSLRPQSSRILWLPATVIFCVWKNLNYLPRSWKTKHERRAAAASGDKSVNAAVKIISKTKTKLIYQKILCIPVNRSSSAELNSHATRPLTVMMSFSSQYWSLLNTLKFIRTVRIFII